MPVAPEMEPLLVMLTEPLAATPAAAPETWPVLLSVAVLPAKKPTEPAPLARTAPVLISVILPAPATAAAPLPLTEMRPLLVTVLSPVL